jgi:hypothetical protein
MQDRYASAPMRFETIQHIRDCSSTVNCHYPSARGLTRGKYMIETVRLIVPMRSQFRRTIKTNLTYITRFGQQRRCALWFT